MRVRPRVFGIVEVGFSDTCIVVGSSDPCVIGGLSSVSRLPGLSEIELSRADNFLQVDCTLLTETGIGLLEVDDLLLWIDRAILAEVRLKLSDG